MTRRGEVITERVYEAIVQLIAEKGYAPTIREVMAYTGVSSTSVVAYHLRLLQRRNSIIYVPRRPRTIVVTSVSI